MSPLHLLGQQSSHFVIHLLDQPLNFSSVFIFKYCLHQLTSTILTLDGRMLEDNILICKII